LSLTQILAKKTVFVQALTIVVSGQTHLISVQRSGGVFLLETD